MSSLSFLFDRLIRGTLFYLLLIALLVIGIPSTVVLYNSVHEGISDSQENALSDDTPLSLGNALVLDNKNEQKPKNLPMLHMGKNPVTFGWTSGSAVQAKKYQKLQIVSPFFAELDAATPVHPVLSQKSVAKRHAEGIKVWGRLSMKKQTAAGTHRYLNHPQMMSGDIARLKTYVSQRHLDGLNIDIENVRAGDRTAFLNYVASLSRAIKEVNPQAVVTVDIQAESGFSRNSAVSYNRSLAKSCDYVIFMGYDEHWSSDPKPGPVTSGKWLKTNISRMIQNALPPGKLLLGLPSYTQIWKVGSQGQNIGSRAVSNEYIHNVLQKEHVTQRWQPQTGTYFSTFNYKGAAYKVWSENTSGVQSLLKLVSEYHLAGFGFWNLDMMSSSQWNTLAEAWGP